MRFYHRDGIEKRPTTDEKSFSVSAVYSRGGVEAGTIELLHFRSQSERQSGNIDVGLCRLHKLTISHKYPVNDSLSTAT